jgi:hypothetical protein
MATQVIDLLNDLEAEGPEMMATLVTALALVATTHKLPGVSRSEIRERCVMHVGRAIDIMLGAREASSPSR